MITRSILAIAALAVASQAHAESFFQVEAGLGLTSATKVGDGMFYSQGFSHSTPDASYGGRLGIVMNAVTAQPKSITPGLRVHLTYQLFGKVHWASDNPQDEADFTSVGQQGGYNTTTHTCVNSNCGDFRHFDSTGGIQALSLTVEPYWDLGRGWTVGVEVGPALYRSSWTAVATALSDGRFGPKGTQETLTHTPSLQIGALGGVSACLDTYCARLNYLYAPIGKWSGKNIPAGIKGMWMLSFSKTFF